jgi:hypothetical protein
MQRYNAFEEDFLKIEPFIVYKEVLDYDAEGKPFILNGKPMTRMECAVSDKDKGREFRQKWPIMQRLSYDFVISGRGKYLLMFRAL